MQVAGRYDFVLLKGQTWQEDIQWLDEDRAVVSLAGGTAKMQVREYPGAGTVLFELSTSNGRFTITGGDDSHIQLRVTAADTAGMTFTEGVYDLIFTDASGKVWPLLEGKVYAKERVTV